ncbi:MAG TPA: PspA/IM30 family protein [Gemmataceae bacterium]|nr:PspA/IM30 family protein [Gemmataceae bacterium]
MIEFVVMRLILWVALPAGLTVMLIGPGRVKRWFKQFGSWLWDKRLDPEQILTEVVRQHEKHIAALRKALSRSETAEADITRNIAKSTENIPGLEAEARIHVAGNDDLGARAALYKLNLERLAVKSFEEQLKLQRQHIAESRRRLYLLELQLRQYEVGRSILLSQLAEAQTVEQQYAIANNFDPFDAIANWHQAEGIVQEKTLTARAVEQVYSDIAEIPLAAQPSQVDSAALDAQLAELKATLGNSEPAAQQPHKNYVTDGHGRNGK